MMSFQYGSRVIVLPATALAVAEHASALDLRVLLALAGNPDLLVNPAASAASLAGALNVSPADIGNSLAFWRGAGVLLEQEGGVTSLTTAEPVAPVKTKPLTADRGLTDYTAAELAQAVQGNVELSALINACQQTFGKIFTTAEVGIIAGLFEQLSLDGEYILLLLSHCVRMEKKSLRYAEKTALSLYDEGVTSAVALEERLRRIEIMADATGKIRTMFGLSSRSFTTKEKKMIENWICTMQYSHDIIRLAYDATVDAIGKPSIAYANTILERWYAEGYHTVEDITAAMETYRRQKMGGSSFDIDDFFEAALKNTYGET
ncbi:MAG: DnaD domain protein [Clostridia bacterium]|nr:DnaD domain protein [Clostridia bacterium]